MRKFSTAQDAFEFYYKKISTKGEASSGTRYLQNIGFYISNPLQNKINTKYRNWKEDYAATEWEWYLSKNRSVSEIKKKAKIWDSMHHGDDIVNSNYGYQWGRNNQLQYVIDELIRNKDSRRAVITIYDGKEHEMHSLDTPCTLNVVFSISNEKLNMSVLMRSNDLWYGFCNDQYCFSLLLKLMADKLGIEIGWYYHFANNLHLYENFLHRD